MSLADGPAIPAKLLLGAECYPSKTSLTVRAMNNRLAWLLSELAVSCNRFFNKPIFDIPAQHHNSPPMSKSSASSVSGESLSDRHCS
jgi:hypothetical protein